MPEPTGVAARRQTTSVRFPPEEEQGEYFRLRVSLAKRICASCPVQRQCADYALAADERYGVWGGLTAEERARQVRRRAVA